MRLQGGDKAAFREIVETHQASVRGLIAYMGLSASDVDDIAQDTFIHVYEHIHEFEPGTNFPAWVKRIARYKALSFLEASRREARNRGRALQAFLMASDREEGERDGDTLMERLKRCLERLGEKARAALEKRYAGVPVAEIAREADRSVDATKMQLFRTRLALKKCVEAGT